MLFAELAGNELRPVVPEDPRKEHQCHCYQQRALAHLVPSEIAMAHDGAEVSLVQNKEGPGHRESEVEAGVDDIHSAMEMEERVDEAAGQK